MASPRIYFLTFLSLPKRFWLCSQPYDKDSDFWERNAVGFVMADNCSADEQFTLLSKMLEQAGIALLKG